MERYEAAILTAPRCQMSVANLLETSILVERRGGAEAGNQLDLFLEFAEIEPTLLTTEGLAAAREAWLHFGKGRHPAARHFGDGFAYALAHVSGEPLLHEGDDFSRTDITSASLPIDGFGGA